MSAKFKYMFYLLTLALITAWVRTAWISDDALITFRTVMNFINGYGPVFNIGERVQAYTHPTWFLCLSIFTYLTNSTTISAYLLSAIFTVLAFWIVVFKISLKNGLGLILGASLIASKAFMEYSTSGLENPLSYFLVAAFAYYSFRKPNIIQSSCYFALSCMNRHDLLLLIGPLYIINLINADRKASAKGFALASLIIGAWTAFSVSYYGFPFPNTAYAKIGNGISKNELFKQGFIYLLDSLQNDLISIPVIMLAIWMGFKNSNKNLKAFSVGILLYLTYVANVGGDFMSGRFIAVPFLAAIIVLGMSEIREIEIHPNMALVVAVFLMIFQNLLNQSSGLNPSAAPINIPTNGIVDERGYWVSTNALRNITRSAFVNLPWPKNAKVIEVKAVCGGLGVIGMKDGPSTHLIDTCGLSEPLLARLPAIYSPNWRIGHFERALPEGYQESILGSKNIANSRIEHLNDDIQLITHGPLFTSERWAAIANLNIYGPKSYCIANENVDGHIRETIGSSKNPNSTSNQ